MSIYNQQSAILVNEGLGKQIPSCVFLRDIFASRTKIYLA